MKQTSSKLRAYVMHCILNTFAWCLLHRVNGVLKLFLCLYICLRLSISLCLCLYYYYYYFIIYLINQAHNKCIWEQSFNFWVLNSHICTFSGKGGDFQWAMAGRTKGSGEWKSLGGSRGKAPKRWALFIKRVDNLAAIFAWKCLESRLMYGVRNNGIGTVSYTHLTLPTKRIV